MAIESTTAMDRPVAPRRLPRRMLAALTTLAALAVLAALAYPSISSWMATDRSISRSRVRIGTVVRGDLERDLAVQGRVVAALHPSTFSPADGIVLLRVAAGDVVEAGTVLAEIESPELESRLEQERSLLSSIESDLERQRILAKQALGAARQRIDLAQVELEAARRAMDRARRSRADGILNDVEFETAQDALRRAELTLAHASEDAALDAETLEFEVRNREHHAERQRLVAAELRRRVDELVVRAPIGGLVSRLDIEDRDAVVPGQPLVTVVDLSVFEVEILVPESYGDEIVAGTPAVVHDAGRDHPAHVRVVSPEVEGNQVRGFVVFEDGGPAGLRQNQRVSTRLVLESRPAVLKVPRGPFLDAGGGREVYRIEGDLALRTPIRAGAASVAEVEIEAGLEEGDRIVVSDTALFEDAERVYLRD